jgi:hypothetical protein
MTAGMTAARPGSKNTDRRLTRRFDLSLPLAAHRLLAKQAEPFTGMTRNISVGGVYFTTDYEFTPGWGLDLIFTLPAEMTDGTEVFIHAQGKVVRVDTKKTEDGAECVGVATVIEKYEIVRAKPGLF